MNVIKYQHIYNDTWIVQNKMFIIITILKQENNFKNDSNHIILHFKQHKHDIAKPFNQQHDDD
jgi:hypothetical protein